jgi:hypothetical protein
VTGVQTCALPIFRDYDILENLEKDGCLDIPGHVLGQQIFPLSGGTFALPSLHSDEEILGIEAIPKQKFTLQHDKRKKLYYITLDPSKDQDSAPPGGIVVKFILYLSEKARKELVELANSYVMPTSEESEWVASSQSSADSMEDTKVVFDSFKKKPLANLKFTDSGKLNDERLYKIPAKEQIKLLTKYCRDFKEKELIEYEDLDEDLDEERNLLNQIMSQQAGVCRHRAKSFVNVAKELSINARIVKSVCHEWVEVQEEGRWRSIDLGGEKIVIKEVEFKDLKPQKESTPPIKIHNKRESASQARVVKKDLGGNLFNQKSTLTEATTMERYILSLYEYAHQSGSRNILCYMAPEQIEAFYHAIMMSNIPSAAGEMMPCYFIADLDQISLTDNCVAADGSVKSEDSRLAKFIKNSLGIGVLLVDWSKCKPQNLGFNTMLDAKRNIEGMDIAENIIVISILEHGVMMGDDFYSRHHATEIVPRFLASSFVSVPVSEVEGETEIIFYHDDWRNTLYGNFSINGDRYIFELSELVQFIDAGQRKITLVNAPWDDREFRLAIDEVNTKGFIYANGKA